MYYSQFYKGKTLDQIKKEIEKEGFDLLPITNGPGYVYHKHQHPETKLLVFLKGTMKVTTMGKTHKCIPGDKLIIPGNTVHEGIVGQSGCTFFWSEKLLQDLPKSAKTK